jgi:hypothetical protein
VILRIPPDANWTWTIVVFVNCTNLILSAISRVLELGHCTKSTEVPKWICTWILNLAGFKVARLALRDVLLNSQSQRDWHYPGTGHEQR